MNDLPCEHHTLDDIAAASADMAIDRYADGRWTFLPICSPCFRDTASSPWPGVHWTPFDRHGWAQCICPIHGTIAWRADHGELDLGIVQGTPPAGAPAEPPAGYIYLDGGTLDLGAIRRGAPWWRPFKRRQLRRQARNDFTLFAEDWTMVVTAPRAAP